MEYVSNAGDEMLNNTFDRSSKLSFSKIINVLIIFDRKEQGNREPANRSNIDPAVAKLLAKNNCRTTGNIGNLRRVTCVGAG